MQKRYEAPECEVYEWEANDVITTSGDKEITYDIYDDIWTVSYTHLHQRRREFRKLYARRFRVQRNGLGKRGLYDGYL